MRRGLALIVTLIGLIGLTPAARAADDPRLQRAELLLKAAELTDRLDVAQSEVVSAQMRQSRAQGELARTRQRLQGRAVSAYVQGTGGLITAIRAPGPYLEVAAAKEREMLARFRTASSEAAAKQERAETAAGELRAAANQLAQVQAQLEAWILADDMRRAEEQRREDEARRAALAARYGSRFGLPPGGSASPGGYSPSPLDPNALVPRHRLATQRQLELMRRIPFGPVGPGPLPASLRPTGQRLEGLASWYGPGFNGRPTASGAIYDQEGWTVASKELPLGTFLLVSVGDRRVLLLVNDRGPYVGDRILDLSAAGARALGFGGVAPVTAEVVA
jgi:hypothetical protein